MDSRFPQLLELSLIPGNAEDVRRLRAQIDEVCRRTGARCLYNVVPKRLHFFQSDAAFGYVLPDYMVRVHTGVYTHLDVDAIVQRIIDSRRSKEEQDRALADDKARAEYAAMESQRRESENRRPEALAMLKRKGNRFGMGKHFRPSVLVDGFKERSSGLLVPQGG